MKKFSLVTFLYALIILIGGWIGHLKSASRASLISGLIFGLLLMEASWLTFNKKKIGVYSAFFLIFVLLCFFSVRFISTYKWLPSGLMSLITLFTLLVLGAILKYKNLLK